MLPHHDLLVDAYTQPQESLTRMLYCSLPPPEFLSAGLSRSIPCRSSAMVASPTQLCNWRLRAGGQSPPVANSAQVVSYSCSLHRKPTIHEDLPKCP